MIKQTELKKRKISMETEENVSLQQNKGNDVKINNNKDGITNSLINKMNINTLLSIIILLKKTI